MHAHQWRKGFLIGILLLVIAWLSSLIWGLLGKANIAISEAREAEWQYQAIEERKTTLAANLVALKTERGQDAAIRTAFGVARPGEEVIVVVPPVPAATTTPPSLWERMLNWFR